MRLRILLVPLACLAASSATAAEEDGYQSGDGTAGIGALTRPVPLDVQAANGLAPGEGTMVSRVFPWAPAGEIGLQEGDVILAIDGVPTNSRRDLRAEVWSNDPGASFEITISRNGTVHTYGGEYGRIPDWLEPRLRLPGERWEHHVEARQREFLAMIEDELAAAEASMAQRQAAVQAAESAARRGLDPLRFDDEAPRAVLGLIAADGPWHFAYHWDHEAPRATELEL